MKKTVISVAFLLLTGVTACFAQGACALGIDLEKEDIYLTVPDSLLGRRVLLSTVITGSESPYIPLHREISQSRVFTLMRVDSSLVFMGSGENSYCVDGDESIVRALGNSKSGVVEYVFKVEGHDSTGFRVKADNLFDPSSKTVVDMEGMPYSSYAVSSADYSKERSSLLGVFQSGNAVCARMDLTFDLKLQTRGLVFQLSNKYPVTFQAVTSLIPMPCGELQHKVADKRIGTYNVPVSAFASDRGSVNEEWIRRWDISKGMEIYLDTLLSPAQARSVCEAFDEWNKAFCQIGLGNPIVVKPYPCDSSFNADDPLVSVVTLSGAESAISATFLSNGQDRILSNRFYIPREYVSGVRRRSAFSISWTDPKYRDYELGEDAVCEVLKADFIRYIGLCLGISPNLSASYAYSPSQLRDSAFVAQHGITASVTDDVLFNYLATPSDRESGVITVVDRVGEYDIYALDWIYGDGKVDYLPEHFYCSSTSKVSDYRARKYDLSNDPFADYDAGLSQIKFVADNAAPWIEDAPEDYRTLFIDWLWLRGNNLLYLLTSQVGGYAYNAPSEDSDLPKYVALPRDVQRSALREAFSYMRDFKWLDSSELVKIAGPNPNVSDFSRRYAFKMANSSFRFQHVAFAQEYAGSTYTLREYFKDLEKYSFQYLSKGKFPAGESNIVGQYISFLASNAATSENDKVQGMSEISYEFLLRSRKKLLKCRMACSNAEDRFMVDYLIDYADSKINFK